MTQPASTPDSPGVPQAPNETAQPSPAAAAPVAAPQSVLDKVRAKLDHFIPAIWREHLYKAVSGVVMALTATGITNPDKSGLWTQVGVATVTLLFALLYAGNGIRVAVYSLAAAGGALLMAYGIAKGVEWAVVVAAVGQALGIATAAAKAVVPEPAGDSIEPAVA